MVTSGLLALALAGSALGHAIMQELYVNGVDQGHTTGIRVPTYDGPITDVTSTYMSCNGGTNALNLPYPTTIINIPAGASVTAEWHHTLAGADASDSEDPIATGHNGPIMVYLAKVDSALQTSTDGLAWFKIYEDGLTSDGQWAVQRMIANKGKVTFTLPSCVPSGNYFLRTELIALHGASSYPGAQFYIECAQINVTGGGSLSPATVSFPGAYAGSDPGVTINIYYPVPTSYTIPGPRPITCGGSTGASSTSTTKASSSTSKAASTTSSTTSKASSTSSSKATSTTSSTKASSTSASSGAPLYGQCGGTGWAGATTCASGTCTFSSAYYSQCLP